MTAYAVARRTREIGVRVAMGARPIDVVGAIVRDEAWPVALGVVAGLAAWVPARRAAKIDSITALRSEIEAVYSFRRTDAGSIFMARRAGT